MMTKREDYGIDAPRAARTLGLVGFLLLGYGLLPNTILGASITHKFWPTAVSLLVASGWMFVSSLWLKKRVTQSLMNQRSWREDETVLDVGCGRGLVAIEAARRAPFGTVHAVDIWQAADLSGNSPDAIQVNAAIAGVSKRLVVETADARDLPYADGTFDVVSSMTAIHNIGDAAGRRKAISEVWRVMKPGGQVLIFDIRHARSYLAQLRDVGAINTGSKGPILLWGPIGWRISATKPAD